MWALDDRPAGFRWLDADDASGNTVSFLRHAEEDGGGDVVAGVVNFGGTDRGALRIGVPKKGAWRVALDTSGFDAAGSPSQAGIVLRAEERPWNDQPWSLEVRVARLSALYLVPAGAESDLPPQAGRSVP